MSYRETTLAKIAATVKRLKEREGYSVGVLIGAGASFTANIPTAGQIMTDLKRDYPSDIEGCDVPTYAAYMNCISHGERKRIINNYIKGSRINLAHFYLASLFNNGFVDVILTTNFDPLTIKSLALFNQYPAIYDVATTNTYTAASISFPAIIFLHGQSHGFWQLNADQELELPTETMGKVIRDINTNRAWIIVGYSGNDPVMRQFLAIPRFDEHLFWVGHKENEPDNETLRELLSAPNRGAFYLKGYDADSFFHKLHNQLKIPTPALLDKPFVFLKDMMDNLSVDNKIDNVEFDIAKEARRKIAGAIKRDEADKSKKLVGEVKKIWLEAQYDKLDTIYEKVMHSNQIEAKRYLALGYYDWGTTLGEDILSKTEKHREHVYLESGKKYKLALDINPDMHEAWYNWGYDLGELAALKSGKERENLYEEALEKYKNAVTANSNMHEAWYNWGVDLGRLAALKNGKERELYYKEALEKYKKTLEVMPDMHEAWYNWGVDLGKLAESQTGNKQEQLYLEAVEKYQKAVEFKPDMEKAWFSWGVDLKNLAEFQNAKEKNVLYGKSLEKFRAAETLKEGYATYNIAYINSLLNKPNEAFQWLEKDAKFNPKRNPRTIEADPDFDNIRYSPRFKEILAMYKPVEETVAP